jgi:hypothetical protein
VALPVLRRLPIQWAAFLSHCSAPALQELTTSYSNGDAMIQFIRPSSCQLTGLTVFSCEFTTITTVL